MASNRGKASRRRPAAMPEPDCNLANCAAASAPGNDLPLPMRALNEKGLAYEAHQQLHKQYAALLLPQIRLPHPSIR
jgi:hypothetical protein